jgi:Asp-tRNA(Asn)/Glu-tRNA(Gln) amidotransferase A subunit family amidase
MWEASIMSAGTINLVEMTVSDVEAGFAVAAFTSEGLTQAFLDRIAVYNPPYNAIVFLNPGALDDARASDTRRAEGRRLGPLDGVPVVVKDAMDMVGFPTTGGWRLLHSKTGGVDLMPETDAPVVARMRAAGAVILGKTNIPVLSAIGSHANDSWAGPTYNAAGKNSCPADRARGPRRRSPRAWRFWASPRKRAGRSRTRPPPRGSSGSSRRTRWCPTQACCRSPACATWLARSPAPCATRR